MPISDKFKALFANQYERYLNARTKGEDPNDAVPRLLNRLHPDATEDDIKLARTLVSEGRANADRINRQLPGKPPVMIATPENPFIVASESNRRGRHYTTEVEFTDTRTGENGKWAISFPSPVDLTLQDIQDIAAEIFFQRYNDSPQFGDDSPDAADIETRAVVDIVVLG